MATAASIPESPARPDGFPPVAHLAERTKHLRPDVLACIAFLATKGIAYFSWNANKLLAALMGLSNATWEEQTAWHTYTLEELGEATGMVAEEVPIAKRELVNAGVWRQHHIHHDPNPASPHYDPSAKGYYSELRLQQTGRDPRAYPQDLFSEQPPKLTDKCPGCGHVGDMDNTRQRRCRACKFAFPDHKIQRVKRPVDDGPHIYRGGKKVPLEYPPDDPEPGEPAPEQANPAGSPLSSSVPGKQCQNCQGWDWAVVRDHFVCVRCGARGQSIAKPQPKSDAPPGTASPSAKNVAQEPVAGAERPPYDVAAAPTPAWGSYCLLATAPRPWWLCACKQWGWTTGGGRYWYCCNCGAPGMMAEGVPP